MPSAAPICRNMFTTPEATPTLRADGGAHPADVDRREGGADAEADQATPGSTSQ